MPSLNELDKLIQELEAKDDALSDGDSDDSTSPDKENSTTRRKVREQSPKRKRTKAVRDAMAAAGTEKMDTDVPPKRRKLSQGLCFKYLANACAFEDCQFRHVKLERLDEQDEALLLADLRKKPYDEALAGRIRNLNIPKCKDFGRGKCKHDTKCRFWHLDDENISKWAGFPFWCHACWKPLTSKDQQDEHNKSARHKQNLEQYGNSHADSWW
eukprot:GEMP01082763.1.p1 GENE.GEMP01082763.1~~GEMP01082763.1.p1  ORF type:complete len:241 (+),score=42.83 GEMP01082763.1:85-723(+)